jgi:hypothetical protein
LVKQSLKPVAGGGRVAGEVVVEEGVNGFDMRQMGLNLLVPMAQPAAHIQSFLVFLLKTAMLADKADVEEIGGTV